MPINLEAEFTSQSSNSFYIYHQNYLAILSLNLTKSALYAWQEDGIFNLCDIKSNGIHEGHNLLESNRLYFPDNDINRNSICVGPPTLQSKPRYIISWVFYSFEPTNLILSRSNLVHEAAWRESPGNGTVQFIFCPSPAVQRKCGTAHEMMSSCSAWESCTAAFPATRHEMSHEQHEITDHRCRDSQWHKYLCCLAVGGRLWEDLPQAPPGQVCLYKAMVI